MNNEVVVVGLWVNSWLFVVDVVLEHVVDNWYNEYPYLWIGDENCCCCWKIV